MNTLTRDETSLGTTQEGTGVANFFGATKPFGSNRLRHFFVRLFKRDALELHGKFGHAELTIGVDALGQDVVDRHI